jgi:YkoY family integral membrane protein
MFGQTFAPGDLATIALLIVLEALLSIDNALVLATLANRLPHDQRMKALSYGLVGAFVLRLIAIFAAATLIRYSFLKLLGALYLLWVAGGYFFRKQKRSHESDAKMVAGRDSLWRTIAAIEFTDLAFAVDSVLAAVALVGPPPPGSHSEIHPKLWVIVLGGMIGLVLMRFTAAGLSRLLERFPQLHLSAYLLVMLIGLKLLIDWAANDSQHPHRLDFGDPTRVEMWLFWGAAVLCLVAGVLLPRKSAARGKPAAPQH